MKRLLFAIVAMAFVLSSCSKEATTNTTISGRLVGSNADTVYLERISDTFSNPERIGAERIGADGSFAFDFNIKEGTSPRFYRLTFGDKSRPVTLVVSAGDNIKVESAGNVFLNYSVEGSEESELIAEFSHEYFTSADELANIAENLLRESGGDPELERKAYNIARSAMLTQVRFVGAHQNSLAAFYAMRHRIAEQYIPQLDGYGINIVHYRSVLEGIKERYPESPYIAILERNIADSEAFARLEGEATVVSYPDIELVDAYSNKHKLSELDGKVVLLYFWSAYTPLCNNLNAELKPIYNRYHDKGFEIYHVSVDADKAVWLGAVGEQKLPWPSLYAGGDMRIADLYNVMVVPTTFIIDRNGDIADVKADSREIERKLKSLI